MHNEHEKINIKKESTFKPLLRLTLGIVLVLVGLSFFGLIVSRSKFFGIEQYYEDHSIFMYLIAFMFLCFGQYSFSKIKMKKGKERDPEYIIR